MNIDSNVTKADEHVHQFEFRGTTGEYFGIWIVNVLLGLVTLGIYSAWAKVRNKKYFYGNTFVDDHNFDYHATGKQLFLGRLIVAAVLLVLVGLSAVSTTLYLIAYLILIAFLGVIINRALRFNARVSSYRNVRFDFNGDNTEAFVLYVLFPIFNFLTLFMATPFLTRATNTYVIEKHAYGDRYFTFQSGVGKYYAPFLIMLGIIFASFLLLGAVMAVIIENAGDLEQLEENPMFLTVFLVSFYATTFLIILPASLIYKAAVRNIIFNNSVLDGRHHFESTLEIVPYIWIIMTNAILSIFSFGLLLPWARVRLAKYLAANTKLIASGSLDAYTSNVEETRGVVSSEYVDIEGIDLGIGL